MSLLAQPGSNSFTPQGITALLPQGINTSPFSPPGPDCWGAQGEVLHQRSLSVSLSSGGAFKAHESLVNGLVLLKNLLGFFFSKPEIHNPRTSKNLSVSLFLTWWSVLTRCTHLFSPWPCGPSICMAHGCVNSTHRLLEGTWLPQHRNALQLETRAKLIGCWTGLGFNVEYKLWSVAVILVLLTTRLDGWRWDILTSEGELP